MANFADLVALAGSYGLQSGATVAQGDFNGDGKVDFSDLVALAQSYGSSLPPAGAAAGAELTRPVLRQLRTSAHPRRSGRTLH